MIKKLLHNIPALITAVFLLWILLSWFDVVADNNGPQPVHSSVNFFSMLSEGATV